MKNRFAPCIPNRHSAILGSLFFIVLATSPASRSAETNAPSLRLDRLPGNQVQITVTGAAPRFHRVDASSNLVSWRPLVVLTNTTGTVPFEDTNAAGMSQRFYRAAEVAPATGVTSLSQPNGSAGTQIEIFGQFFDDHPGDNVVRIGDVNARILEASATRLLIEIPTNAVTGPITVTTPGGETTLKEFFVVTAPVLGTFAPPAGVNAAQFDLVNAHGDGVPLAPGNPTNVFLVSRSKAVVSMAVPTNGIDENIFFAVTLSDGAPFVIDAASSAQGLVFLHPQFQVRNPAVALSVLSRIAADPKVQLLASNIAATYPLGGNPFTNAAFLAAYSNALVSVSGLPSGGGLMAQQAKSTADPAIADADEAEPYIEIKKGFDGVYVKGSDVNPVDWSVTLARVNTGLAFPNGEEDYRRAVSTEQGLKMYADGGVIQQFIVRSHLYADRLELIEAVGEELSEIWSPDSGEKLRTCLKKDVGWKGALGADRDATGKR